MGEEEENPDSLLKNLALDLHKAAVGLKGRDIALLKSMSDHTVDIAAMHQDEFTIEIAVLVYSLGKIVERFEGNESQAQEALLEKLQNALDKAELLLRKNQFGPYKKAMHEVFEKIRDIDEKFSSYIQEVIEKARINKGSKMYERGISLARSAEVFGLLHYDLMNYVGKTVTADAETPKVSTQQRLLYAQSLFGAKHGKNNRV